MTILQDLRYGARMLLKNPGFALIAALTMALGIGANTAIFSVVNAVLLRPLPFKDPERLVRIWESNQGRPNLSVSPPNFFDWQEQSRVFEEMAAFRDDGFNLTSGGDPERIVGARVTAGFFPALGVAPVRGRVFSAEEDRPGGARVVIISHRLWQRRFGQNESALGRRLTLDGQSFTVVGVMPLGFKYPQDDVELWVPYALNRQANRGFHFLRVIARVKPAVSIGQARVEMDAVTRRLAQDYPQSNAGWGVTLRSLHDSISGDVRTALLVLSGAVAFVLLIACVNVANLLLAHAAARRKEIVIRASLGAAPIRLLRQLLTESLLLALIGGGLGSALAFGAIKLIVTLNPGNIPRADEIGLDGRALGFTASVSLLAGIIFGLAPALQISKADVGEVLKGGRASTHSPGQQRLSKALIVSEIALALMLLIGAGLMLRSFARLTRVDPGFNPRRALTVELNLSQTNYKGPPEQAAFWRQALERVRALPGIQSVAVVNRLPLKGNPGTGFSNKGQPDPPPSEYRRASFRVISQDYFSAMGIPLLRGRAFTEQEAWQSSGENYGVVIINQALARRYWPDEDPLGKRIGLGNPRLFTIIGIAADVKDVGLDAEFQEGLYAPVVVSPSANMTLIARIATEPRGEAALIRGQLAALDKDQAVAGVGALEELLSRNVAQPRFNAALFFIFGALALALALAGIYGVMAYAVTQRTREFGLRMALGAQRGDVLRLVLGQGLWLTLPGIGVGLIGAIAGTKVLAGLLFQTSRTDAATFAGVMLLLAVVALAACYFPARRATKVDPMIVLRQE